MGGEGTVLHPSTGRSGRTIQEAVNQAVSFLSLEKNHRVCFLGTHF